MEWLSDDPTYLAAALGVLALAFFVALRVTQQGKYLVWALIALGLAGAVVVVERLWVTDNERIEQVVYALGRDVATSDAKGVLSLLTENIQYGESDRTLSRGPLVRAFIQSGLEHTRFDFVRIRHLTTHANPQSRRGSAEFQTIIGGSHEQGGVNYNFAAVDIGWSLGLEEKGPGVWKVNRITPTRIPSNVVLPQPAGDSGRNAPRIEFRSLGRR
jgi:hypothetical protein